jgi:hypothetical protein
MKHTKSARGYVQKSTRKIFNLGAIILLAVFSVGCTTHYGSAAITSSPSGAQVYDMDDGFFVGVTPVKHAWRSGQTQRKFMNIRLQKGGYEDEFTSFWLSLDHGTRKGAMGDPMPVHFELKKSGG